MSVNLCICMSECLFVSSYFLTSVSPYSLKFCGNIALHMCNRDCGIKNCACPPLQISRPGLLSPFSLCIFSIVPAGEMTVSSSWEEVQQGRSDCNQRVAPVLYVHQHLPPPAVRDDLCNHAGEKNAVQTAQKRARRTWWRGGGGDTSGAGSSTALTTSAQFAPRATPRNTAGSVCGPAAPQHTTNSSD
jgi:hypothetical protein